MRMLVPLLLFAAVLLFGCANQEQPPPPLNNSTAPGNSTFPVSSEMTKELCESALGNWNECGSACRGKEVPGSACVAVCVPYCECGGLAGFGCPRGFECSDYLPEGAADAMGICKAKASQ